MRGPLLVTVLFVTMSVAMSEIPHWMGTGHGEGEMARMMEVRAEQDRLRSNDLYQRSMLLDTCQVQTQVLEQLRQLVVDSIAQVKKCMALGKDYQYRYQHRS